ncbi:MAG: hypothetical protein ABR564_06730 [Candidatus Dormibacteria bacterium]
MTVNAVAFYALGALIVGGSLATVAVRRLASAGLALAATMVIAALLEGLAGSRMLALIQALLVGVAALTALRVLRRQTARESLSVPAPGVRLWPAAAALATAFAVMVTWVSIARSGDWHHGAGASTLLSVLHEREPVIVGVAVVLLVTAAGGGLLLCAVGDDEREFDRRHSERRHRDERTRRRREDRLAARGRPGPGGGSP